jgi:Ca-activated chloride channel family protein
MSILLSLTYLLGCSASDAASTGATPGGAQDEALANEKIEEGIVPNAEDITVEGELASQDLPLEGTECKKTLCISSAYAIAPTLGSTQSAVFVQMGFNSGIDENTFERNPLNLSVVVDRSGSMAGEKIAAVKTALSRLVNQLNESDRLSIVLFDDRVEVLQPSTLVAEKTDILAKISRIYERGSTNLSDGLKEGFSQVEKYSAIHGVSDRVIVFTDARANAGSTDTASFISQAKAAAEKEVGLTVFGVGIDLNQELVLAISNLRGGNYAYLSDADRVSTVFDKDFGYLVTPLAYDLKFILKPAEGFSVKTVYGFPSWDTANSDVEIDVATLFLSRGHGAIVARLEPTGAWPHGSTPLSSLNLEYVPTGGIELENEVVETLYDQEKPLSNTTLFYSQNGVRRTVAYVNAALGMKEGCARYWDGRHEEAITLLDDTHALLVDEASAAEDSNLTVEAERVLRLRENMVNEGYDATSESMNRKEHTMPVSCSFQRVEVVRSDIQLFVMVFGLLGSWRRRKVRKNNLTRNF